MKTNDDYVVRRRVWDARALLSGIGRTAITMSQPLATHLRTFLWYDLCAESDAGNLYKVLCCRRAQYSVEFFQFLEAWYLDEMNHAAGFTYLQHLLFSESEADVAARAAARPCDFAALEEFLDDEFLLCTLFAYDEYASVMTYEKDTFYRDLGSPIFEEWIRRVRADEAIHFGNLIKLIHFNHSDRVHDTREVIRKIVRIEKEERSYQGTFLFDHECPHFLVSKDDLESTCANVVLRRILNDPAARLAT